MAQNNRYVIGGVALRVDENLPQLASDGWAHAEVTVDFIVESRPPNSNEALIVDSVGHPLLFDSSISHLSLLDAYSAPEDRSWQLRQAAPFVGALLGLTVLHASAVVTKSGALLFVGASGRGKSTLADRLMERGFEYLADDLVPLIDGDNTAATDRSLIPIRSVVFLAPRSTACSIRSLPPIEAVRRHVTNGFGEHGIARLLQKQFDDYLALAQARPHYELVQIDALDSQGQTFDALDELIRALR